jgi:tetratricopeptide (TPR) repeat protein
LLEALEWHIRQQGPGQLRAALAGCAWLVRLLPELATGPIEPLPAWTLSPDQERRLMCRAVIRFLTNVAGPAGTLLVLDDLQWAGADALDLLVTLARSAPEARLRVIGAYRHTDVRPEDVFSVLLADLVQAGLVTQHTLQPLAREEAALLLQGLLGRTEEPDCPPGQRDELEEQVLQRAGGVPFFLVSCAHGLRASNEDSSGARRLPWNLTQSIRQRMAALPEGAREMLGLAAVAGRVAPRGLLLRVAGRTTQDVVAALEAACQAGLLEEAGPTAYRFVHDVIREVVETELSAARRALLHQQVAAALEQGPGEPAVDAVAYHYAQTEDHARAADWLERAGDHAAAGFANAAALEDYAMARAHVSSGGAGTAAFSRLDEKMGDLRLLTGAYAQAQEDFARARGQETVPVRRAELWRKEGHTWDRRGEFARALEAFDAAEREGQADSTGQGLPGAVQAAIELSRSEVYCDRGDVYANPADYGAAEAAARRVLALIDSVGPAQAGARARARAERFLGWVAWRRGDLVQAEDYARRSLALMERSGDEEGIAWCCNSLSLTAMARGDLAEAEACGRHGQAIMERIGEPQGRADASHILGEVLYRRGDLAGAEQHFRYSLALCESLDEPLHSVAWTWPWLGRIAEERGDVTAAATWCRRARRLARRMGLPLMEARAAVGHARACLRSGRLRLAALLLERAQVLTTASIYRQVLMEVTLLVAELHIYRGAIAEAQARAGEAVHEATERGWRWDAAQAQRCLGQCALAEGLPAEAHLRTALTLQLEMDAALEAARTRLLLAQTLATETGRAGIPAEARMLLIQAQAQFVVSGAALDLAQAEQLATAWESPHEGS